MVVTRQKNPRTSVAPPVQLFHPAFGHFLDDIRSNSPLSDDIIRRTTDYMQAASAIYKYEDERRNQLTPLLCKILGVDVQNILNEDKTNPDGIVEKLFDKARSLLLLKEEKNEVGASGRRRFRSINASRIIYWPLLGSAQGMISSSSILSPCDCSFSLHWLEMQLAVPHF